MVCKGGGEADREGRTFSSSGCDISALLSDATKYRSNTETHCWSQKANTTKTKKETNRLVKCVKHPVSMGRALLSPLLLPPLAVGECVLTPQSIAALSVPPQSSSVTALQSACMEVTDANNHTTSITRTERDGFRLWVVESEQKNNHSMRGEGEIR